MRVKVTLAEYNALKEASRRRRNLQGNSNDRENSTFEPDPEPVDLSNRDSELEQIEQNLRVMHDGTHQANENEIPSPLRAENISPLFDGTLSSSSSLDDIISSLALDSRDITTYDLLFGNENANTESDDNIGANPPSLLPTESTTATTGGAMFSPSPPGMSPPLLVITPESSPSGEASSPQENLESASVLEKEQLEMAMHRRAMFGDYSLTEDESSSSFASSTALSPFRVMVSPNSVLPQKYKQLQHQDGPSTSKTAAAASTSTKSHIAPSESPDPKNSTGPNSLATAVLTTEPSASASSLTIAGLDLSNDLKQQHLYLQELAKSMTEEEKRRYSFRLATILKQKAHEANTSDDETATLIIQSLMPLFAHLKNENKAREQKNVKLPPFHDLKRRRLPGSVFMETTDSDGSKRYIVEGENEVQTAKSTSKRRKRALLNDPILSQVPQPITYNNPQIQQPQQYPPQQQMQQRTTTMSGPGQMGMSQQQMPAFDQHRQDSVGNRYPVTPIPTSNLLKEYLNSPPQQYRSPQPQSSQAQGMPTSPYVSSSSSQQPPPLSPFSQFSQTPNSHVQEQPPKAMTPFMTNSGNNNNFNRNENLNYRQYYLQNKGLDPQRPMSALPSTSAADVFKAPLPVQNVKQKTFLSTPSTNFGSGIPSSLQPQPQRFEDQTAQSSSIGLGQRRGAQPPPLSILGVFRPEGSFQGQSTPRFPQQMGQGQQYPNQFQFQNSPVPNINRLGSSQFTPQPQPQTPLSYGQPASPFQRQVAQPQPARSQSLLTPNNNNNNNLQDIRPLTPNSGSSFHNPYDISSPPSPFLSPQPLSPASPYPVSNSPVFGVGNQRQQSTPTLTNFQNAVPTTNHRLPNSPSGVPFRVPPPPYPQQFSSGALEDYNSRMLAGRDRLPGAVQRERYGHFLDAFQASQQRFAPQGSGGVQSTNQPSQQHQQHNENIDSPELEQYRIQKQLLQQRLQQQQQLEQQQQKGFFLPQSSPQQQLAYRQYQYPTFQQQSVATQFKPGNEVGQAGPFTFGGSGRQSGVNYYPTGRLPPSDYYASNPQQQQQQQQQYIPLGHQRATNQQFESRPLSTTGQWSYGGEQNAFQQRPASVLPQPQPKEAANRLQQQFNPTPRPAFPVTRQESSIVAPHQEQKQISFSRPEARGPAIAAIIPQQKFGGGSEGRQIPQQTSPERNPQQQLQQPSVISGGETSLYNRSREPTSANETFYRNQTRVPSNTVDSRLFQNRTGAGGESGQAERRDGGNSGSVGSGAGTSGFAVPIISGPYDKSKFSHIHQQQQQQLPKQSQSPPPLLQLPDQRQGQLQEHRNQSQLPQSPQLHNQSQPQQLTLSSQQQAKQQRPQLPAQPPQSQQQQSIQQRPQLPSQPPQSQQQQSVQQGPQLPSQPPQSQQQQSIQQRPQLPSQPPQSQQQQSVQQGPQLPSQPPQSQQQQFDQQRPQVYSQPAQPQQQPSVQQQPHSQPQSDQQRNSQQQDIQSKQQSNHPQQFASQSAQQSTGIGGTQSNQGAPTASRPIGDKPRANEAIQNNSRPAGREPERVPGTSDRGNASLFAVRGPEHSPSWGPTRNDNNFGGNVSSPQAQQNPLQRQETNQPPGFGSGNERGRHGQNPGGQAQAQIGHQNQTITKEAYEPQQYPKHLPHHGTGMPFYTQSQLDDHHNRVLDNTETPQDPEFENDHTILQWYLQRAKQKLRERGHGENRGHPGQAQAGNSGHEIGSPIHQQGGFFSPTVQPGNVGATQFFVAPAHSSGSPAHRGQEIKGHHPEELSGQAPPATAGWIPQIPPSPQMVQAAASKTPEPRSGTPGGVQTSTHPNGLHEIPGPKASSSGPQKVPQAAAVSGLGAHGVGGSHQQHHHRPNDSNNNSKHEHHHSPGHEARKGAGHDESSHHKHKGSTDISGKPTKE